MPLKGGYQPFCKFANHFCIKVKNQISKYQKVYETKKLHIETKWPVATF
jgi:hypothetical protein